MFEMSHKTLTGLLTGRVRRRDIMCMSLHFLTLKTGLCTLSTAHLGKRSHKPLAQ